MGKDKGLGLAYVCVCMGVRVRGRKMYPIGIYGNMKAIKQLS